jgi:hypothetical protein
VSREHTSDKTTSRADLKKISHNWIAQREQAEALRRAEYKKPGPKSGSKRTPLPKRAEDVIVSCYVPDRLDFSKYPEEWLWPIAHWLDQIYYQGLQRWKWLNPAQRWVNLKARYLAKVVPSALIKDIRQQLVEDRVIECDGLTERGRKSLGYRLTDDYRSAQLITCTDPHYADKIYRTRDQAGQTLQPVHRWIARNLDRIRIDLERAQEIIKSLKKPKHSKGYSTAKYRLDLQNDCQAFADSTRPRLQTIDKYGRVHTSVVSLKRELRNALYVVEKGKRQQLYMIDISNSQPLIAGIIARRFYDGTRMSRSRLLNHKFTNADNPYHTCNQALSSFLSKATVASGAAHPPLRVIRKCKSSYSHEMCKPGPVTHDDVTEFLEIVQKGEFVSSMMTANERLRAKPDRAWSAKFKVRLLVVLFKEYRKTRWRNQLELRFKNRFPSVYAMLEEIKKTDYRRAAWLLQNYESTILIHRICGRIMREHPTMFITPIHDCIATTRENVGKVSEIIKEEFAKLGVNCRLKVKEPYL